MHNFLGGLLCTTFQGVEVLFETLQGVLCTTFQGGALFATFQGGVDRVVYNFPGVYKTKGSLTGV